MNAIFHHDQEQGIEHTIQEMANHIQWLRTQPNANATTIQQRASWLKSIIDYRASAQATIQETTSEPAHHADRVEHNPFFNSFQQLRWQDYEGARSYSIQKAMETWPELY